MKKSDSQFVFGESYRKEVKTLLASEGNIDVAVAFVGEGANLWFSGKKTTYRIIINLASGATNPSEIEEISKSKNCKIKQLDNLHAKVFISNTATIVGSANLSANGLGLEGNETANLEEAGFVISPSTSNRQWFEDMWSKSREISKDDLKLAHEKWALRRKNRPVVIKNGSIEFLKNRNIELIVAWEEIDPEVKKEADKSFKSDENNREIELNEENIYAYYCDFIDINNEPIDINNEHIYFDYWIGKQGDGKLKCNGIARPMTPERTYGEVKYLLHDDKIGHEIHLKKYQSKITKLLESYLKSNKLPKDEGGIIVKLDEILPGA